jgi:hypothetical protein
MIRLLLLPLAYLAHRTIQSSVPDALVRPPRQPRPPRRRMPAQRLQDPQAMTLRPHHLTRATARAHAAILRRKHPECRYVIRWVHNSRFHWRVIEIPRDGS